MAIQDEQKWLEAINRTGFDLEYRIQQILREHDWHVINNRYYIDDKTGVDREIDIVAYKAVASQDITCYTYLIISCKKSLDSSWIFLTSDVDESDEEFDDCPLEIIFSDTKLQDVVEKEKRLAVRKIRGLGNFRKICDVPHRVLSFQQINKKSFKNEDDKRIFSSIITTIKAAAYEQKYVLSSKKTDTNICINFNLLSIFEGGLKENYRNLSSNTVNDIQEVKYINRHIIDNTDRFYRVHFISDEAFEEILIQYDEAAQELVRYYNDLHNEVYSDIFNNQKSYRMGRYWNAFVGELMDEMYDETFGMENQTYFNNGWITGYEFKYKEEKLIMYWDFSLFTHPDRIIGEMNNDQQLKEVTAKLLKKHFEYDGMFEFKLD